jgi:hypothetical protein
MNGNGPPPDAKPSELWLALTQLPRPHHVVDFPRKDPVTGKSIGQVAIWALTQEETMVSFAAAEKFAKEKLRLEGKTDTTNLGYERVFNDECAVQTLWRACRRTENLKLAAFPDPNQIRREFTVDEMAFLFDQYLRVRTELGPIAASMSDVELEAWIDALAKAGDTFPLGWLSPEARDRLTLSLALRCSSSPTAKSSAGSPPDAGTPDSPAPSATDDAPIEY